MIQKAISKIVEKNNLSKQEMTRLFYVTSVFSFEETGKENRERWQLGVELLNNAKTTSDAEIILLALEIMGSLNIDGIKIQLSHAGILKALLKELALSADKEARLLNQIRDGNWKSLAKTKSSNSDATRLLSLLLELRGKSSSFLENLKSLPETSPELKTELNNFSEITSLLDSLNCRYQIDITSARDFEYYTGICFQFMVNEEKIGGGGRYDDLVPLIGGENTPACGFALYMDPLINLAKPKIKQDTESRVFISGITATPDIIKSCFELAQSLHNAGYITELDFSEHRSEARWMVTIQQGSPPFIIIDQSQNKTVEVPSIASVIDMIGGSA